MKSLTASQTKRITQAVGCDQVSAAANVMIETPLELIKCILLKHETAVIEVMKELHEEKMRLQDERDELLAVIKSHGIPVKTYSFGRPHYIKGELE
jgi:hypothetical protein